MDDSTKTKLALLTFGLMMLWLIVHFAKGDLPRFEPHH